MRLPLLPALALLCTQPVIPEALPRVAVVSITTHRTATTLWIVEHWSATGAPDAFRDTLYVGTQPVQNHALLAAARADSFSSPAPAPGSTVSGTFVLVARRRTLSSPPVTRSWTYTEPDVPPPAPTVDSLIVRPVSIFTPMGTSKQVCAIYQLSNGESGLVRSNSTATPSVYVEQSTIAACQQALTAYRMGL